MMLFNNIEISDHSLFFAGSIAPDTGISPDISHWCVNGDKTTCDAIGFYNRYISNCATLNDRDFYLGYYIHLLTDVIWHKQKIEPLKKFEKETIKRVKESWKCVDNEFLQSHKNFYPIIAITDKKNIEQQWYDYYSINLIKDLVNHITSSSGVHDIEKTYININVKREIENFIKEASAEIYLKLSEIVV